MISGHGEKATENLVGPGSQLSGRVGKRSYARFKAEIELHNIHTTTEHDLQPQTVQFGFLCPAAATCAPPRAAQTTLAYP